MDIILKKTKEVPFEIENLKGKFICKNPSASDFVSFWTEFRAAEGSEKEKAVKQTNLVTETFTKFISEIVFDGDVKFKDEAGNELQPLAAIAEYFSILLYQKGTEFMNPSFTGGQADPLDQSSAAS